jgi:L-lactate dehydrogenase complex protein LldG
VLLGCGPLVDRLELSTKLPALGVEVVRVSECKEETCRDPFFAADIGISGVDYLIAESGTIVVRSRPREPRSLSLLPPVHIAVAGRDRVLADLFDLFETGLADASGLLPSCITLITGPSKTGDIELRLVTGVHGPGEVHVVLVGN